ncbi:unnamed protein product, partial [Durusdinium trenchii]
YTMCCESFVAQKSESKALYSAQAVATRETQADPQGFEGQEGQAEQGKGDDKKDVNKGKNTSKKEGDGEFPTYSSLERSSSSATTPSVDSKQIKEAVAAYLAEQKSLNSRNKVTQKLEKLKSRLAAKKKAWVQFQERLDAHRKAQKEVYEAEVKELEKGDRDHSGAGDHAQRNRAFRAWRFRYEPRGTGHGKHRAKDRASIASKRALSDLTERFNAYMVQRGEVAAVLVGPQQVKPPSAALPTTQKDRER